MADGRTAAEPEQAAEPEPAVEPAAEPAAAPEPGSAAPERPHWLQRSLAGLAVLVMAVVTAWGMASPQGALLLLPLGIIASPLFVREREAFRVLCLVLGGFGLLFGTLLAVLGLFTVIPSAVVLLLAATADPRRRPVLAHVYAGAAVLWTAAVLTGVGSLAYDAWLRPSYAYSVVIPGPLYGEDGLARGTSGRTA